MSQTDQDNTGKRSIIESVVIVVSILLAFAIEALWDEQLENFTETKELGRLHSEFVANRDRIDRSINSQDIVRAATQEFYNLIKDVPDSSEPVSLPNNLIQAMLFAPTFDVTTPVLDSLLLSGNLSVIEDESVLRTISAWQRSVAQVTEAEVGARDFTDSELFPALIRRGNIGPLLIVENEDQRPPPPGGEAGESGQAAATGGMTGITDQAGAMGGMTGMGGAEVNEDGTINPPPAGRNRFTDERQTFIAIDNELKGVIAQRIREAGRSAQTLDELKNDANRLIAAIESAQEG
ncbi:MAG: hypothetical protein KTR16_16675 [Acidiferrobacterales bacterium]|nr:hypothetical protein [Acidiferrobacterales bacterium]